jgi:hypothetical protein
MMYGLLAEFESPQDLLTACEAVRDAGYSRWDAHSPFPVHGLEDAMGLRGSRLGWLVLCLGFLGAGGALLLQWWISTTADPLVISGKPFFSWPAFIPVTFEVAILGGAFAAVFGMLAVNKLPMLFHPLFSSRRFLRVTDDRFFISIEARDPRFDLETGQTFLRDIGATHVEVIQR